MNMISGRSRQQRGCASPVADGLQGWLLEVTLHHVSDSEGRCICSHGGSGNKPDG